MAGAPSNMGGPAEFNIWGTIVFKGRCQIGTGGKITIGDCGKLILGDDSKIMSQCNITAYEFVEIGNSFLMAHCSQIFDTGYHYVADFRDYKIKRLASPISIGNNCWQCNRSTIMGGVIIPDCTIVASNSLVNKSLSDLPEESIIGGSPAKLIATGYRLVQNKAMCREIGKFFTSEPEASEYIFSRDISHEDFS